MSQELFTEREGKQPVKQIRNRKSDRYEPNVLSMQMRPPCKN